MEISGDYLFDAPQQLVWNSLQDPNVLGSIMPGGKGFEQIGDNQYSGMLEVKVGPVHGLFQGRISLLDIVAPQTYQIEVDGKGAPGFVKATGKMRLETRDKQTFMEYSGQAQVGGRIASVGQRMMDSATRSIIRQSLESLNEYLKIEVGKQASQPQPVAAVSVMNEAPTATESSVGSKTAVTGEHKPPSQMALTFKIARDVLNDFIPSKYQPWLFGTVIVAIVLILWLIASH